MTRTITPLAATKIKTAKVKEKVYKMFYGGGLYLQVSKTGDKLSL